MKMIILLCFILSASSALADTPPASSVKSRTYSGDGLTAVTTTGASLNVNVTNPGGGTQTVNQGAAGVAAWLAAITSSALPTNACQETGGHLASIDTKLTSPLSVTGNFYQTTQPVSGTFWQATQPVSGTLTCNAGTGTQAVSLASLPPLVAGTATIGNVNVNGTVPVSGTFYQATQPVSAATLPLPTGAATAAKQPAPGVAGTPSPDVITVQGVTGMTPIKVDASSTTQPVSGTVAVSNFPATQPVSGSVAVTNLPATQTVTGSVSVSNFPASQTVSVSNFPATQAVSAVSLPLPTGAATAAKQPALGTAGTASADVLTVQGAASMTALKVDGSATTQPVSGSVSVTNQPTTLAVTQATGTNLHTVVDSGSVTATISGTPTVSVSNFPATQAVSAASLPLPSGAATSANQATEISSLSSIDAGIPAALGAATTANSMPVNIASDQTVPVSAAALPLPSGASTAANQATEISSLATIVTNTSKVPSLGLATPANSQPVSLPIATTLTTAAFTSSTGVANTDLLSGTASGWYDVGGYSSFYADIYTTTTVTGGVITFEQTTDTTNDSAGGALYVQDATVITQSLASTLTLAASTVKHFQAPIVARYIRFRLSTAFAGTGTVGATVQLKQTPYIPPTIGVAQATASSLNANIGAGTITTVSSVTSASLAIPGIVADVGSAAITTTTTSTTITPSAGVGYIVNVPVTAASGTTPSMVIQVNESLDSGTNWRTVYTFPAITTTGSWNSPPLFFRGNRIQYVQTIAGTSPSFTRAINRLQMSAASAAPVNNNATFANGSLAAVTTLSAPINAAGFTLQNPASSTAAILYVVGGTASATTGIQLQPGQDSGFVPAGANVSVAPATGTQAYSIQWVQQ